MGGFISTAISIVNIVGGCILVGFGYNWKRTSRVVACLSFPLLLVDAIIAMIAGHNNNNTWGIVSTVVGVLVACLFIYASFKKEKFSDIILGVAWGSTTGVMLYLCIIHSWKSSVIFWLIFFGVLAVIGGLSNMKQFRYILITQTAMYGAYLMAASLGQLLSKYPSLYPFGGIGKDDPFKADFVFYLLFTAWILVAAAGIWYQIKHSVADPKEEKLTVKNVFNIPEKKQEDDSSLIEAGKKEDASYNLFGGESAKTSSKPSNKNAFVSAYDEEAEQEKKRQGAIFGSPNEYGVKKSSANEFGSY